jgi:RNA recognition motif-containing protein
MSTRLYAGNLGVGMTSEQLQAMFARFGTVNSARVATDAITGKPKGFGFVEMDDTGQADAAIKD